MHEKVLKIVRMREGGHVQRCHTFPHHGSYDVAQHSFHMLLLLEELHPDPSRALYSVILRHDLLERWTGDLPGGVKRRSPRLSRAMRETETTASECLGGVERLYGHTSAEDRAWVKALDQLEFVLWCDDQKALGASAIVDQNRSDTLALILAEEHTPAPVREFLRAYHFRRARDLHRTHDDWTREEQP